MGPYTFHQYFGVNKVDIIRITETWLSEEQITLATVVLKIRRKDRMSRGEAVVMRKK